MYSFHYIKHAIFGLFMKMDLIFSFDSHSCEKNRSYFCPSPTCTYSWKSQIFFFSKIYFRLIEHLNPRNSKCFSKQLYCIPFLCQVAYMVKSSQFQTQVSLIYVISISYTEEQEFRKYSHQSRGHIPQINLEDLLYCFISPIMSKLSFATFNFK